MASPPNLTYGQVPTAGQWNQYFSTKQDALGYTPVDRNGDTMFGKLNALASSTSLAGFNLQPGTDPTNPIDGDIWTTNAGLFVRIAGATVGPVRNGNVAGPSVSVVGHVALFSTTDGSQLEDSGSPLGTAASHDTGYFLQPGDPNGVRDTILSLDGPSLGQLASAELNGLTTTMPSTAGTWWNDGGIPSKFGTSYPNAAKIFYSGQYGILPGVDLAANFDGFLSFAASNGAKAVFSSGTYLVSQTGQIRTGAVVLGNGPNLTVFKSTSAFSTANGNVLQTLNFPSNTGTQTKLVTDPTMTWGFELQGFAVDGSWNQSFTTATTNAATGRGINIYGRRYITRNVGVYNCSGMGYYTECGNPSSPPAGWFNDYRNNQDTTIEDLDIQRTAYEGFTTFGPGDTYLNRITVGIVGDTDHVGLPINSLAFPGDYISGFVMSAIDASGASGTHEIGVIHTHTCWNGWNFRALGGSTVLVRLKAENLIAEGGLGSVYLQNGVYAQISKINTRNNNVLASSNPTAFADVRLSSNFEIDIGSIEGRKKSPFTTDPGLTGVRIDQDNVQIGQIKYQGNGQPGHGVTVEASRKHVNIGSIWAPNCRGTSQDGTPSAAFYSKATSDDVNVQNLMSQMSDIGWRNASTGKVAVRSGAADVSSAFASNVVGIQLDATPANMHIRQSLVTSTTLAGSLLRPNTNMIVTLASANTGTPIDPSVANSNKTLTIAHGLWRTPDYQREVGLKALYNGTKPSVAPSIEPTGADATNITANYNQSVAAASATNTGTVLNLII